MQWTALDAQLAAHACADEKEARDVAFVRAFLRAHPADAHLRSQPEGHLTGSGFVLDATRTRVLLLHHGKLDRWLHRIDLPTLLLWGERDGIVSTSYGEAWLAHILGAQLEVIADAGHFPHWEQPRDFADRLSRFLDCN